jgi:hypothetical protein
MRGALRVCEVKKRQIDKILHNCLGRFSEVLIKMQSITEIERPTIMWRCAVLGLVVYAFGHPAFESIRPGMIDPALQGFHVSVNKAALDSTQKLGLDDNAVVRSAKGYMSVAEVKRPH